MPPKWFSAKKEKKDMPTYGVDFQSVSLGNHDRGISVRDPTLVYLAKGCLLEGSCWGLGPKKSLLLLPLQDKVGPPPPPLLCAGVLTNKKIREPKKTLPITLHQLK